jgi:hypothetical protein
MSNQTTFSFSFFFSGPLTFSLPIASPPSSGMVCALLSVSPSSPPPPPPPPTLSTSTFTCLPSEVPHPLHPTHFTLHTSHDKPICQRTHLHLLCPPTHPITYHYHRICTMYRSIHAQHMSCISRIRTSIKFNSLQSPSAALVVGSASADFIP